LQKNSEISDRRNLKIDKICNAGECGYMHKHFDLKEVWT